MNWQAFPPRSSKPNWKTTARTGSSPGPVPGPDGTLAPSAGLPFTHIQKPAGTAGFQHLPLVEWVGLTLARGVGLPAPETALVVMPDDMPPALLVERLDIRDRADDRRMIAMEDMCSVLDLTPEEKYTRTIERVVRAPRTLSTDPEADLLTLLKRVLFAWLSADSDMHLKNMALLKTAQQGDAVFQAVPFAPVYDALTTRVFPGLEHYRMALKLGGKDERLGRAGFVAVTALAGLRAGDASVAMDAVLGRLTGAIDGITIPPACVRDAASAEPWWARRSVFAAKGAHPSDEPTASAIPAEGVAYVESESAGGARRWLRERVVRRRWALLGNVYIAVYKPGLVSDGGRGNCR